MVKQSNPYVQKSLTATGSSQLDSLQLLANYNQFTSVPQGSGAMLFQNTSPGLMITIRNDDPQNSLNLYPSSGSQIDSLGANGAYSLASSTTLTFVCHDGLNWTSLP